MKPWLVAMFLTSCATEPNPLLATPHGEPFTPELSRACDLANRRCTHCHSLDRVLNASFADGVEWRRHVHDMRLMPGSAIRPEEEPVLVRCLVFRVAGTAGVQRLDAAGPQ